MFQLKFKFFWQYVYTLRTRLWFLAKLFENLCDSVGATMREREGLYVRAVSSDSFVCSQAPPPSCDFFLAGKIVTSEIYPPIFWRAQRSREKWGVQFHTFRHEINCTSPSRNCKKCCKIHSLWHTISQQASWKMALPGMNSALNRHFPVQNCNVGHEFEHSKNESKDVCHQF